MAAGRDDVENKAEDATPSLEKREPRRRALVPTTRSAPSVFFSPKAEGKQEAPQELENPFLDITDANAVIDKMNSIAIGIPPQQPPPPKPQIESPSIEEEDFLKKGKTLLKAVLTPKKKKEEKEKKRAKKKEEAQKLYHAWLEREKEVKLKQTEAKEKLIKLLWNALVVRSHDFIENPNIQAEVHKLIVAYYEALAKILFKKGSGSIRGQLHKEDSDIALSFLKEKIDEEDFVLFRIMVSYVDTLDYDEAAGWLRQDNSLSKLLFSEDFWPAPISDEDKIQKIISTLKFIFFDDKTKKIFIHLHLCAEKHRIKNHNLENPNKKQKLSITDAEGIFTRGLNKTLEVILAPFIQAGFVLTEKEKAQKEEKDKQRDKIASWFRSLLTYSIAPFPEEIPPSEKKTIYIRKEGCDLHFGVYRPDEDLEEGILPDFFEADFDEEVLECLFNEASIEMDKEKESQVIGLKNAILERLAQEGFAPSLFYYPELESLGEEKNLSTLSENGASSTIAYSDDDEEIEEEDRGKPTTPLLTPKPDGESLKLPETPSSNSPFIPSQKEGIIVFYELDLHNDDDKMGTPVYPPTELHSTTEPSVMHSAPNSSTRKDAKDVINPSVPKPKFSNTPIKDKPFLLKSSSEPLSLPPQPSLIAKSKYPKVPFTDMRNYLLAWVGSKEKDIVSKKGKSQPSDYKKAAKRILSAYESKDKKEPSQEDLRLLKAFPVTYIETEGEFENEIHIHDDEDTNTITFTDSHQTKTSFSENIETNSTDVEVSGQYSDAIQAIVAAAKKMRDISGSNVFVLELDLSNASEEDQQESFEVEMACCAALLEVEIVPILSKHENAESTTAIFETYKNLCENELCKTDEKEHDYFNEDDRIYIADTYLTEIFKAHNRPLQIELITAFFDTNSRLIKDKSFYLQEENAQRAKKLIAENISKKLLDLRNVPVPKPPLADSPFSLSPLTLLSPPKKDSSPPSQPFSPPSPLVMASTQPIQP